MTDELNNIIFSSKILNVFRQYNWMIIIDTKNKLNFRFVGEIADYYLNISNDTDKIYLQFTIDLEIPKTMTKELLMFINIANNNSKEGFFVFDAKFRKIKFNLILHYFLRIDEKILQDFLEIKLDLIQTFFHYFVSGVHNLVYGENIKGDSLELLFFSDQGCA